VPRWVPVLAAAVLVAAVACLIAGLPPLLPVVLAALALAVAYPLVGMIYVLVVLTAPLGLWMIRVDDVMSWTFGGREYALSLSSSVIAVALMFRTLIERPPTRRQLAVALPAVAAFGVWVLVGVAHHGLAQTAAGARITALPVILLVVASRCTARHLDRLITVTAWLVIANGVAAVVEYAIGPARLIAYGFEEGRAVRLIGDTFRAPGLTEVNAELGLLAGSYLLGYAALWLVRDLRPHRLPWHVAAGAAAVCLGLSTSRSGALLLAAGLVAAVVLNRGGGAAARRRAGLAGIAVVVLVVGGFAAVGATGSASLFERFTVWGRLIGADAPWYGLGVGGVGAATYSRAASTPQVFVDNYFVSVVLQFGYVVPIVLAGLIVWGLFRLSRRSAEHPHHVVYLAVLAGTVGGCLMIELWEYGDAMVCLALFVAYAARRTEAAGPAAAEPVAAAPPAPAAPPRPPIPAPRPAVEDTVRLQVDAADTVVMNRPAVEDTVVLINPGPFPDREPQE
jgi:hypothetical protein